MGNLDNYNIERKKVDLDSTRSKGVLEKYLEYKKKFIESSANSDDPTQSKEVQQYKKLSEQHLTTYHALQSNIKESYTSAKQYSEQYTHLDGIKRFRAMRMILQWRSVGHRQIWSSPRRLIRISRLNSRPMLPRRRSGSRQWRHRKQELPRPLKSMRARPEGEEV